MSGDDEIHGAEAAAGEMASAVQANVSGAAASLQQATDATADGAEQANKRMTEAATAASQNTAKAFSDARERLGTLSAPFGNPAFDAARQSGEAIGKGFESSYASTLEGMAEFNSKAIAAWRSNAETAIAHWQTLAGTKSLSEAIALNAEVVRKQMEALSTQARDLSALATRIMRDAVDPLKMSGR